jgi:hypothetical protein
MSGDYQSALAAFDQVVEDDQCAPEWRLKLWLLRQVVSMGIDRQDREPEEALRLSDVTQVATEEECRTQLSRALEADALCSRAWFKVGMLESSAGNHESALGAFAFAGRAL